MKNSRENILLVSYVILFGVIEMLYIAINLIFNFCLVRYAETIVIIMFSGFFILALNTIFAGIKKGFE